MRNLFIIGVLLFLLFRVYQERGVVLKSNEPEHQAKVEHIEEQKVEAPKEAEPKPSEEPKEKKEERTYTHKPEGFVERVITNAVSDFVKTPAGKEMAKSMLTPRDADLKGQSVAFSTNGFSPSKRKYDVTTLISSSGKKTICGQKIKVQYQIQSPKNPKIETQVEEFILGKSKIPELNAIADGLALNEVVLAKYLTGDAYATDSSQRGQKISLSVIEHLSQVNFDYSKVRIFDDYISTSDGVECDDKVKVNYHIFSINGESIKQGEVTMRLGDFNYPEIMTYALDRMPLLGTRTVLLPQNYLSLSKANPIMKSASNNYVIMELSRVFVYPKNSNETK